MGLRRAFCLVIHVVQIIQLEGSGELTKDICCVYSLILANILRSVSWSSIFRGVAVCTLNPGTDDTPRLQP